MNDLAAMKITSEAMSAQRTRMRVIAENLANIHTTGPDGPYQRKEVLLRAAPISEFAEELDSATSDLLSSEELQVIHSVAVEGVVEDGSEPIMRYDPAHPMADENGYVRMPNIDIMREMVDMIEAQRSYEANMVASRTAQDMTARAMDLLG